VIAKTSQTTNTGINNVPARNFSLPASIRLSLIRGERIGEKGSMQAQFIFFFVLHSTYFVPFLSPNDIIDFYL
jgi:hypothetical protein